MIPMPLINQSQRQHWHVADVAVQIRGTGTLVIIVSLLKSFHAKIVSHWVNECNRGQLPKSSGPRGSVTF